MAFVAYPQILHWLQAPYCSVSPRCSLYVTGPLDGLSLRIHVATYAGAFLASPVILWQVWRFVTPGLRRNEKRYVVPFVAASLVLFAAGAALALVSLPHALRFLGTVGARRCTRSTTPTSTWASSWPSWRCSGSPSSSRWSSWRWSWSEW